MYNIPIVIIFDALDKKGTKGLSSFSGWNELTGYQYIAIFTSLVSGRGNIFGSVSLSVCVCVCLRYAD